MTRKQIASALDRLLGGSSSEWVIRELRSSIVRAREARSHPRPLAPRPILDFVETLTGRHKPTDAMLKRVRLAVAKAQRMR